ncbi:MAG: ankyrin repeat domain-containing protein [Gammaproteobacteria bacterium]
MFSTKIKATDHTEMFFQGVKNRNLSLVIHALENGADINAKNTEGLTALQVAVNDYLSSSCFANATENFILFLLECGAHPSQDLTQLRCPYGSKYAKAGLIPTTYCEPSVPDFLLHAAVKNGLPNATRQLLLSGFEPFPRYQDFCLHARRRCHIAVRKVMMAHARNQSTTSTTQDSHFLHQICLNHAGSYTADKNEIQNRKKILNHSVIQFFMEVMSTVESSERVIAIYRQFKLDLNNKKNCIRKTWDIYYDKKIKYLLRLIAEHRILQLEFITQQTLSSYKIDSKLHPPPHGDTIRFLKRKSGLATSVYNLILSHKPNAKTEFETLTKSYNSQLTPHIVGEAIMAKLPNGPYFQSSLLTVEQKPMKYSFSQLKNFVINDGPYSALFYISDFYGSKPAADGSRKEEKHKMKSVAYHVF